MKKIFLLFLLISSLAHGQEDTSRYLKYPSLYGPQYTRGWFTNALRVPFIDTVAINALPGALQAGLDGNPYWWDGVKWGKLGSANELAAYVKYADSVTKYVTPTQLLSYNYISTISGIAAGGDLSGIYPNPTVSLLNGHLPSYYLDRANHTGTQSYTAITGLSAVAHTGAYADLSGAPSSLPTTSALGDVLTNGNFATTKDIHVGSVFATNPGGMVSDHYYNHVFTLDIASDGLHTDAPYSLSPFSTGVGGFYYTPVDGKMQYFGPQYIQATGGNGYTFYTPQSSDPGTPASGFVLFSKSTGSLAWKYQDGWRRSFPAGTLTGNRDYILPDASGTLSLLESTQTWSGVNTFSNYVYLGGTPVGAIATSGNSVFMVANSTSGTHAIQNLNVDGYSSFDFADYLGALKLNFGYANPSATSFPGTNYINTNVPLGIYYNGSSTASLKISSAGIGIGTNTAPSFLLDIKGTAAASAISSDIGYNINPLAQPAVPTLATIASSGNLGIGVYRYTISITTALGETSSPFTTLVTTTSGNQQVNVSWTASTDYRATGYKIYRTALNGNDWETKLLTTIGSAATTLYVDNIADGSLTGASGIGTYHTNSTSNYITINGSKVFQAEIKATILGLQAGVSLNGGGDVLLMGYQAGKNITTATETTIVGQQAGSALTGGLNQMFGYNNMPFNSGTANNNVLVGHRVLYRASSASSNVVVGHDALYGAGAGSYTYNSNTVIGFQSGNNAQSVSNNTYVGYQTALTSTTGSNNVFLGFQAGYYETGDNKLFIDNQKRASESDARVKALMYGVFASTVAGQSLIINGSLAVNGGASLTGVLTQTATLTAAGTTGAQTINKPSGSVNFAAGATTLVVTNSLVAITSQIFLQVYGTDATARYATATLGSGSFTITLNAAATAETKVGFRVDGVQ